MKMRKILSFVLVLALVLGSFSMAFAATPADVVGTPNAEAVDVLMGLGVVNGYEDGSYKPENIVTRAEMAKLIVVALGLQDYAVGTSKYPDMAGATWAQGYVTYATGLGVIEGYPDGTFKPSATVSFSEAATMIVRALGYTDSSLLPATWPANYVVKAKALGIFDDVTTSALGANRGAIAQMLYNALSVNMVAVDSENKITTADPKDNMLLRLGAKEYNSGNAFLVKGDETAAINLRGYVGAWATAYTVDDEIVAVHAESTFITGKNQVGDNEFLVGDTTYKISAAARTLEATTVGSIFNVTAGGAYLGNDFYNGEFESYTASGKTHALDTLSSASPYTLAVKLDGNTITKVYSVSAWGPKTATGVIEATDLEDITDDNMLFESEFIENEDGDIDTDSFDIVGAKSLSEIKVGDVVYAYKGFISGDIRRIAVGTAEVTGEVTRINSDGNEFVIAGKTYSLSHWPDGYFSSGTPKWNANANFEIELGEIGTAKLDAYGNLYSWEVTDNAADNYAIVLDKNIDSFYGDSVRLFTKAGDEVVITDTSDTTGTPITDATITTGALVVYSVDKNGKLDVMNLKTTTTGTIATAKLSTSRTTYDNKLIASDVVVFSKEGPDYSVVSLSDVKTGVTLGAVYYADTKDKIKAIVVDHSFVTGGTDDLYAFINTVGYTVNADGDNVLVLDGVSAGKDYSTLTVKAEYTAGNVKAVTTATAIQLYKFKVNSDGAVTFNSSTAAIAAVRGITVSAVEGYDVFVTGSAIAYSVEAGAFVVQYDISENEYTVAKFSAVSKDDRISLFKISDDSIENDTYDYVVITVE